MSPVAEARARVAALQKALARAQAKSTKACNARGALRPGSTRARVTTANARWASAAEARDRVADLLAAAESELAAMEGSPPAS